MLQFSMIVYGIILVLFTNFTWANYDNYTWVDYETLRNYLNNSENIEENYRSTFYINKPNYYNNFPSNKSIFENKIVGGTRAKIKNYRFQVSIQERGFGHFCGGSLITSRWIVTAAHCFYGSNTPITNYFIRAGSNFHSRGGVIAFPSKIYVARKFNPSTNDWDIALIKLKNGYSKKNFPTYPIRRILIKKTLPPPKTQLVVTGWGYIHDGGPYLPEHLRKVKIPLMNHKYCNTKTNNAGLITKRQFCAGLTQGSRDSCQGDSGGPITVNHKLVGIVSWGFGCALPNSPGVYTNVPKFLPYIKRLIRNG